MPGRITKLTVVRYAWRIYRMGGWKLIATVLVAKKGTPFLTVYARFIWN